MSERAQATQQAYDSVAADFAERTASRSDMAAEFFDRFVAALGPRSLVLDMGCGPGHDLGRFGRAGHRAIGVDRSGGLLTLCPAGSFPVRGDLGASPIRSGAVDGVWSSAALLHVERADLAATLLEWKRVLRPGGVLGFATSLGESVADEGWELVPAGPNRRPEIAPGERRWFVHHDEGTLIGAVRNAGLSISWSGVRHSTRKWLQVLAVA